MRRIFSRIDDVSVLAYVMVAIFAAASAVLTGLASFALFSVGQVVGGGTQFLLHVATIAALASAMGPGVLSAKFVERLKDAPQRPAAVVITAIILLPADVAVSATLFARPGIELFGMSAVTGGLCCTWIAIVRNIHASIATNSTN